MKNMALYVLIFLAGFLLPTSDLEVSGFSKLGFDAPAIKMKKFTFMFPDGTSSTAFYELGIPISKIISYEVLAEVVNMPQVEVLKIPEKHTGGIVYFQTYLRNDQSLPREGLVISLGDSSISSGLYSKPFSVTIIHE